MSATEAPSLALASALPAPSSAFGRDIPSAEAIRNSSRLMVLDVVRRSSPLSLAQLVEQVPLSRTTISGIAKEMLEVGLLQSTGLADSTGGRRPIVFSYRPDARQVVGVTLVDDDVLAVLADLEARPLRFHRCPWKGRRPEDLVQTMIEAVRDLCSEVSCQRILGVGVGLPGLVDAEKGTLEIAASMGWLGPSLEVRHTVEEALGLPTTVANRGHVLALGEMQRGVAMGARNVLYAWVGRGVVAGIVLNGRMHSGWSSTAGEIGHSSIDAGGPLCRCGNRGCLEVYTNETAMVARSIAKAREAPDSLLRLAAGGNLQALTLADVVACARQGDPAALCVIRDSGTYLGIALSAVLHALDPEVLVIGGPIGVQCGPLLLEPTVREIERRTLPNLFSKLRVASGSDITESGAVGAAVLALSHTPIEHVFGTLA